MRPAIKITSLVVLLLSVTALFLCFDVGDNIDYVLKSRSIRLATMLVVGTSVAFASIIFQTITNNRILTPSIMGYESIFILFQTIIVFIYGDKSFQAVSQEQNFVYAVLLMIGFSGLMYLLLFGKEKQNIFKLLLLGMVLGTIFSTISNFLQVLIDPNQFSIIQNFMFVSFTKMNTKLLLIATATLSATLVYIQFNLKYLDVLALGRAHAINLGLNYNALVKKFMLAIALLVSVATALVGPITFLGILITNLTYELFNTRKHQNMVWLCSLLSCLFIIAGQFMVEHVFNFSTTVSIVINFIGGIYFMYVILKSRRKV